MVDNTTGEKTIKLSPSRQKIVDDILEIMANGVAEWQRTWGSLGRPNINASTLKAYHGVNAFILMIASAKQNRQDNRWATFNQAKEKGYSIKAGAKGVPIDVYKTIDKRTKTVADMTKIKAETKNMTDTEKAEFYKKHLYMLIKTYHVFNGEDIEGLPPLESVPLTVAEQGERVMRVENILKNSQAKIYSDGGGRAYYSPSTDTIHLPQLKDFYTIEDYYATALHEVAHSTGHSSRLDRDLGGGFCSERYALEELRAEFSSALMCNEFGAVLGDKLENCAAYLSSWHKAIKESPDELFKAIKDADSIVEYVLGIEPQKATESPQHATEWDIEI